MKQKFTPIIHQKMLKKIIVKLSVVAAIAIAVSSCSTPKDITYLQDFKNGQEAVTAPVRDITAVAGDKILITVHSKNQELAEQFNPVSYTNRYNARGASRATPAYNLNQGGNNSVNPYIVDGFGDIDFPVLGMIHVGGLNRHQIAEKIENEIKERNLIKDPMVSVEFLDHAITVLGSVSSPGRLMFDRDHLTLLEGIALAGDLQINGQRTNVKVIRNIDGKEHAYEVDLTDAKSVYSSPAYYLQPNDIIYVEPNNLMKRNTTPMGSQAFTPAFWMSMASFVMSTLVLILKW